MANSPFNIIKTHLWSEVKEYTWGNLTIGQNYKSVLSNVQSSQTTKKDSTKTFVSTFIVGVGNVGKSLARLCFASVKAVSLANRAMVCLLSSSTKIVGVALRHMDKTTQNGLLSANATTGRTINRLVSTFTSLVSSLATELTVLLYTIQKTIVTGVNLSSGLLRKAHSVLYGYITAVNSVNRSITKTISGVSIGSINLINQIYRNCKSNVVPIGLFVRQPIKRIYTEVVIDNKTLRKIIKPIIIYVLNDVINTKHISDFIYVNVQLISELKCTVGKKLNSLINSYGVKTSNAIKLLKTNVVSNSIKLVSVGKELKGSVMGFSSKFVAITKLLNSLTEVIASSIKNFPYKKLLVATVNIVYKVPPIVWADNKLRTWAELTSYRWREFDGTFATGVWKKVFVKLNPSNTNLLSGLSKYSSKNVISFSTTMQSIARVINKSIEVFALYSSVTMKYIERLFKLTTHINSRVLKKSSIELAGYIETMSIKLLQIFKVIYKPLNVISNLSTILGKAIVQELEVIAVHVTEIFLKAVKKSSDILSVVNSFVHEISTTRELAIQMSVVHKIKQEVIWRMGANARGETLHMVLNETKVIELSVFDEDGTPSELDGGNVKFAIGGAFEKECGIVGNKITVMIEPDDIENTGTYDYEFRLKDIFNRVDSLIMGKVIVEPKVVSTY